MNLPNYFLADLPDQSAYSATIIGDACQTLKQNRARYLAERPVSSLIRIFAGIAQCWLDKENPFRQHALEFGPAATGFSRETLANGLDVFFRRITAETLQALLLQEFGDLKRLETLGSSELEEKWNRASLVRGPELLAHITGGQLPNPTLTSIMLGFLLRSAQFVKCASGTSFIPRLFAHSIYEVEPKLGACLEIAEWKGGTESLENALFAEADCVTATGSDETLEAIRNGCRLRPGSSATGIGSVLASSPTKCSPGWLRKKLWHAPRVTWWRGTNWAASRRMCFTSKPAGIFRRKDLPKCSLRNWRKMEKDAPRGTLADAESAHIAYRRSFMRCARPIPWIPNCGAARIDRLDGGV